MSSVLCMPLNVLIKLLLLTKAYCRVKQWLQSVYKDPRRGGITFTGYRLESVIFGSTEK